MGKRNIILSICMSFLMALALPMYAQQAQTVKGTVVDVNGDPVIGATVRVQGTDDGTITDMDGKYLIKVPAKGKLEISFVGYKTELISDMKKAVKITLVEDSELMEEVVVVGYGSQKAKHVTAAIEVMDMDEIQDLAVTNLGDALAGMINGVHVDASGNRPGEASHLTIRQSEGLAKNNGQVNSKFSSQDDTPLYIIDDFFASEDAFNQLDPSEVESISVLKDAAAAIYGAQGAYGVILVKTKSGREGTPKISYSGQFGITDALMTPKMMNSYQYARTWNGYQGTPDYNQDEILSYKLFQADEMAALRNVNYNYLDDEWKAALTQRHSVNIQGGTNKATYFAGVSYNTQEGNIGKLDYQRWNYRAGVNINLNKWMKTSLQVSGDYGEKETPVNKYGSSTSGDYNLLLQHLPFIPETLNGYPIVYQGMDYENTSSGDNLYNFRAIQNSSDYRRNDNNSFQLNASFELDMGFWKPLQGLKLKASYSKSVSNSKNNSIGTYMPVYQLNGRWGSGAHLYTDEYGNPLDISLADLTELSLDNGNQMSRSMSRSDSYQLNLTAIYAREFGDHRVSAMFSFERGESESEDLEGIVLSPLSFTDGQSNSGTGEQTTAWGRSESGRMSYLGRINYSYADKYMLEFSLRSDASNKFAPKNYWGMFPSVSAGWNISEESWFENAKNVFDFLKIRGSFGILGRDNINSYVWMTRYNRDVTAGKGMLFGSNSMENNLGAAMTVEQGGANPDAHWDKTYKTNFGIEARMLKNRLSVNVDAYYDFGRQIFGSHQGTKYFPMTVGIKPTPENFVEKDMYGIELSLGWKDKIGKDFSYWVRMTTGLSDDRVRKMAVKEVPDLEDPMPGERQDRGLWGMECMGMFRSYQEIDEYFEKYNITSYLGMAKDAVKPGMLIYKDAGGAWDAETKSYGAPDGIVSSDGDQGDLVRISKRSDNPYGATFNFGASYKGWSIQAQLGASWGAKIMANSNIRKAASNMEYTNIPEFWSDMFVYDDVIDEAGNIVAESNRAAKYPNLQYDNVNNIASTFWALDGTTISMRNITLAYTAPKSFVNKLGLDNLRVNVTCQNAINFVSPHIEDAWSSWGGNYGNYPNLRKITVGLNLSF